MLFIYKTGTHCPLQWRAAGGACPRHIKSEITKIEML